MSVRLVIRPDGIRQLGSSAETAEALHDRAKVIAKRVRAPRRFRIDTRAGVSSESAFAQVQMFGPDAIRWEFGSRTHRPQAPLRNALRSR